jgi:hypothetical protein
MAASMRTTMATPMMTTMTAKEIKMMLTMA